MENVYCFYHSNASDIYGICFTLLYCFPTGSMPTRATSSSVSVYTCTFWFSCRCLVIMEGDDSSYGGVIIVVLLGGSLQGACPPPLAVSLDPSATQYWRKIRLGRVCEPWRVWAGSLSSSWAADESRGGTAGVHQALASSFPKPGSQPPTTCHSAPTSPWGCLLSFGSQLECHRLRESLSDHLCAGATTPGSTRLSVPSTDHCVEDAGEGLC